MTARQSRRAAQLATGNVVFLDTLRAVDRHDSIPDGLEFTVTDTERTPDGRIRAAGTVRGTQTALCLQEDRTVPVRVTAVRVAAGTAYAVCRREELPLAMQPAFPRGADYAVTRAAGMPLMPAYLIREDERLAVHLTSGTPAGTAATPEAAVDLIASSAPARAG